MMKSSMLACVVLAATSLAGAAEQERALTALGRLAGGAGVEAPKAQTGVAVGGAAGLEAAPAVFTGYSRWTTRNGFSTLEMLGVQGDAEDTALAKCQAAGFLNCVVTGSQIDHKDSYACEATASARELALAPGASFEMVSAGKTWTRTNGGSAFSALEQHGVLKSARDRARALCQEKGLLDCVVIGSSIDSCNDYDCEAKATARGRK